MVATIHVAFRGSSGCTRGAPIKTDITGPGDTGFQHTPVIPTLWTWVKGSVHIVGGALDIEDCVPELQELGPLQGLGFVHGPHARLGSVFVALC